MTGDDRGEIDRLENRELDAAILEVLRRLPEGSTVADVLATRKGRRIVRKWELKYGRKAPFDLSLEDRNEPG